MATKNLVKSCLSLINRVFRSESKNTTNDSLNMCYILDLPTEVLQIITESLTLHDVISLSQTCQRFYTLINDNNFWIGRIRIQFPISIANLYIYDIFQEPDIIESNDESRSSGFEHVRECDELDRTAIISATHYNDEAIEKRHAKMFMSRKTFLSNVQYFQYRKPSNIRNIPFMKLIYIYLIDRKRTSIVNMDVTHRNDRYLVEANDRQSLTGRIIQLKNVCWLEITGRFEHKIMPGKYQATWRMKCHMKYVSVEGNTEFCVVPSHGKMLSHKISNNDFKNYLMEYGEEWFLVNLGEIIIYEISTVFICIRNWLNGMWKRGISWDCIELKSVP